MTSPDYLDLVLKNITKDYGDGVLLNPENIISKPRQVIPVSPALDIGLSGGIPEGSTVSISGPSKGGKSSLALYFAATAQKKEFGGRHTYYLDVEGRLKEMNLTGTHHLDVKKFTPIRSDEHKILTGEEYLTIAETIIKTHPKCVLIIDSLSAICPEKELTGEMSSQIRASTPKLLSLFFRRVGNIIPINSTILIVMQHMIANTSGYGVASYEDGGNYVKYQSDVKLRIKNFKYWTESESETPIGQVVNWEVVFSALGAPGQKVDSYLRFGHGIDEAMEVAQLGVLCELIKKKASWYTCDFMEKHLKVLGVSTWDEGIKLCKVQGENGLADLLRSNPKWLAILNSEIQQILI